MKTLLIATRNAHKVGEIRAILGDQFQFLTLNDFPGAPAVVEDAETFAGNATKKAAELAQWLVVNDPKLKIKNLKSDFVLADDSGLEVDALHGAPGVFSARFSLMHPPVAGPPLPVDEANNRLLLERMRGVEIRTARFVCAIALADGGQLRGVWRGAVEGIILDEPRGAGGFGYDPLFFSPQVGCTFGEASDDRKFAVSHRGQALRAMLEGAFSDRRTAFSS